MATVAPLHSPKISTELDADPAAGEAVAVIS